MISRPMGRTQALEPDRSEISSMDVANLLSLPEHDGGTCKMERTVALWSQLRIKITNVKASSCYCYLQLC